MNEQNDATSIERFSLNWTLKFYRKWVHNYFNKIQIGTLILIEPNQTISFGEKNGASKNGLTLTIKINDPVFYSLIVTGGDLGFAEGYIEGLWETSDLPNLIRLFIMNRPYLGKHEKGFKEITRVAKKMAHLFNKNTLKGSRKNIAAHYDLGNDFFSTFLDKTMMYSAAYFSDPSFSLEDASHEKNDVICRKLDLKPSDHLLEIGSGWGGFAIHAALHYGCQVTTTTISSEQYAYAKALIESHGLQRKINLIKKDYRDLTGKYDKVVSIEMIEAVGHQFYDKYFNQISCLLKEDGLAFIQAIIIDDRRYESAIHNMDFIKTFVFPGSCIPSITAILQSLTRATDMRLFHLEDITGYYVKTLQEWRKNFLNKKYSVLKMGYPFPFIRLWDYYLSYCEGGFAERVIGNVQLIFAKPGARRHPISLNKKSEAILPAEETLACL